MHKPNANIQYLSALVVSLMGLSYGIMTGISSPMIVLLTSDKSPLPCGRITQEEASWIPSLKAVGSLIGFAIFGYVANKFGRKWPFIFLGIPLTVSWLLIIFAQNVYFIFVARLLHGLITGGVFSLSQLYFVEISNDNVRGALGSSVYISGHIGVVIAFAFGAYFDYNSTPILGIVLAVLFGVLFGIFFPESPLFLLKGNNISEAKKSIRFYQNIKSCDDHLVEEQIAKLQHQINNEITKKSIDKASYLKNPGRKAMIIGLVLSSMVHLSGAYAMMNYAGTIFQGAGSIISTNESALIIGVIQFIGTCTLPFLVERVGRKLLYIVSTIGSTLGLSILGTYILLKSLHYDLSAFGWVPIVSLSFVVLIQSIAVSTLSFAVTAEVLPENLREFGASICNTVLGICSFIVLKSTLAVSAAIGLHGLMFLFAGICIPYTIFIIFYMPETKSKSYDEIMKLLQ